MLSDTHRHGLVAAEAQELADRVHMLSRRVASSCTPEHAELAQTATRYLEELAASLYIGRGA